MSGERLEATMFGDEQKRYVPVRSKPYMGSGPEVEEPVFETFDPVAWNLSRIAELEKQNADLTAKLQDVNLAFAAHLARCQAHEGEPVNKGCL